jgi:hypothetical protein
MKKSTLVAAVFALVLAVTGAVSALFLTVGGVGDPAAGGSEPVVVTEYVDSTGAPLEAAATASESAGYQEQRGYENDEHDEYEYEDDEDHDDD